MNFCLHNLQQESLSSKLKWHERIDSKRSIKTSKVFYQFSIRFGCRQGTHARQNIRKKTNFLEDPHIDEPIDNLLWCLMEPAHVTVSGDI